MISPLRSQTSGLIVSALVGFLVAVTVWVLIARTLDFWYIGDVFGPALGIILGSLSVYEMFTRRLREIPLNWVGVSLFLGKPTGNIYQNGIHWIFPSYEVRNVPAPTEKYILRMPGERIDAQDGSAIFFGISEDAGKRNRIQYSVVKPTWYIAVDDPEDELKEAYLEEARLFFGQTAKAIGVKNEKTLFSDFIVLPPRDDPSAIAVYAAFKTRLKTVTFLVTGSQEKKPMRERLFSDDSVDTIMKKAGNYLQKVSSWGIGAIIAFTPNVRENPEAEQAAAQKQAAREQMVGLGTKVNKISSLAKQMTTNIKSLNPDLALTVVAGMSGQQGITIENKTINVSGVPETLSMLGKALIDKMTKP